MKKYLIVGCLVFFIAGFAAAQIGPGRTLYVSVKTVDLKSSSGLIANTVTTLNYGDEVTVKQVNGKFVEVRSVKDPSLSGWTASANFSTKKIISGNTSTMSAKEVALAGKGFNQDVENSYSTQGQINFSDVDKIETITIDDSTLTRFIEEGHLSTGK
jgi:esterase/lipase superfamily enzyme